MPEDASVEAIRAAVDAIIPSVDGRPGAADLGVHRHVVESIEQYLPGFVDLLGTLLDAFAADVKAGSSFARLDATERATVLRAMSAEEGADMRDVIDGLFLFTCGGMYSEWSGYDRSTRELVRPGVWEEMGYGGPSRGHLDEPKAD